MRNATDIKWMFHSMPWTTANLHNWETPKVTTVQNLFSTCRQLQTVDICNMTLSGCTSQDNYRIPWNTDNTYTYDLLTTIILSWKYFDGTPINYYFARITGWSRASMLESLYTNQFISEGVPGRDISLVKNVYLPIATYNRLTQDDLDLFLTVGLNVTYY